MWSPFAFFVVCSLFYSCLGDLEYSDAAGGPSKELHLSKLRENLRTEQGKALIQEDFLAIKGGQRRVAAVGELPENKDRNRYDELPAFDETRVKLRPSTQEDFSGDFNDYINANYINGYNYEREYVATQGPLVNTAPHFWKMIWQLNATKIVMLANLIEHNKTKVDKYWPENEGNYGEFTITKVSQHDMPHIQHVLRIFRVRKAGVFKPRIVRHFHFTGWPDLGVPSDRMSVVALLRQARSYNPHSTAPIVVHCSAGVGRTGTVILTDSMIEMAKAEGRVDFAKRLESMRLQRIDVVEKKEQYLWAHSAIDDLFQDGSRAYLRKVEKEYDDGDYDAFLKEYAAPSEFPQLIKKMDWHLRRMKEVVGAFRKEYRKDMEIHNTFDESAGYSD